MAAGAAGQVFVVAFTGDAGGQLTPAFDPREFSNETAAIWFAKMIENQHDCVVVWSRPTDGTKVIHYTHGEVPELE